MSSFLSSLHRQLLRTPAASVLILSHGLTLRCLLMRFLHLSVDQFDALENPAHCERIDISRGDEGDHVGQRLLSERRGLGGGGGAWGDSGRGVWGLRGVRLREGWQWKDWRREEVQQAGGTATEAARERAAPQQRRVKQS